MEQFYRAKVLKILGEGQKEAFGTQTPFQNVQIQFEKAAGKELQVLEHTGFPLKEGETVVVSQTSSEEGFRTLIFEPYRLNSLIFITFLFIGLVVAVSGRKGLYSLLGLVVTLFILILWIIPQIVSGGNPLLISFSGSLVIATVTLYLAHGFNKRTTLSLISTLGTLIIALLMALLAVNWAQLFGMGSEDATSLNLFGAFGQLDLKGLLLGAIVIGTLGVLDDVTTAQTATVHEIHKANPKLSFQELYARGLSVGREHIASLVNTLVIAYVGASFPIFLLLTHSTQPLWVIVNNEFLAEEIVRTLVGSTTLVLAVPISTVLAAYAYAKKAT